MSLKLKIKQNNILTIDGLSGAGKGSVACLVAQKLNWALLDSGAIYRALALLVIKKNLNLSALNKIVTLANDMDLQFKTKAGKELLQVYLNKKEVSQDLRTENCATYASKLAKKSAVREVLLIKQRAFAHKGQFTNNYGLVADGRDMGTVVFPNARIKIFLTANAKERAKRRLKQLQTLENNLDTISATPTLSVIENEINVRDERDIKRKHSPLRVAPDALQIDTSNLSIEVVLKRILAFKAQKSSV